MDILTVINSCILCVLSFILGLFAEVLYDHFKYHKKREIKRKSPDVYCKFYSSIKDKNSIICDTKVFKYDLAIIRKDENQNLLYDAKFTEIEPTDKDYVSKYVLTILNKSDTIIEVKYFIKDNKQISLNDFSGSALKSKEGITIIFSAFEKPDKLVICLDNATLIYDFLEVTSQVIYPKIEIKSKLH